jgi:hypothetical protein
MRPRSATIVNAPEHFEGRGRAIITASSGMEYAYEGDHLEGEGQPSVFTEAVVEGLETGNADLDHDQLISVDDLYGYVYDRVKETTPSQTPNKKSEIEGPLYLARTTYRPPVEPLDPELLVRTHDRYAGIRVGAVQELSHLLASPDPAVALAAREALIRMTDDDSRQVSANAQAALSDIERSDAERAELEAESRDRLELDQGDAARTPAEPVGVTADDWAETGTEPIEPDHSSGAAIARGRVAMARWPRRRTRLVLAAVVIAVAAIGAIIAAIGSGGAQPDYRVLLSALPASIRSSCKNDPSDWMKSSAQVTCEQPNYGLTYGLWSSPTKAQQWVGLARGGTGIPCAATTTTAIKTVLPHATTGCEDNTKDKGIDVWWNDARSRVAAQFFWFNRDQATALNQWKQVATAR